MRFCEGLLRLEPLIAKIIYIDERSEGRDKVYSTNFLVGNICDLIVLDEEDDEHFDPRDILTVLQKKVKYGVPNVTAISVCESIFNDRLLAINIAKILSDDNIETDKILDVMKNHSEEIFSFLDPYPKYFKDKLSVLMK